MFCLMFFLIASSLFLVSSMFYWFSAVLDVLFSGFSCINLLFGLRAKTFRLVVGQKLHKKKNCLKETLVFLDFNHFFCRFVFSCMIFKNILPLFFFQMSLKNILFLFAQSQSFCSKKKPHQKKNLIFFILCLLSLLLLFLFSSLFF